MNDKLTFGQAVLVFFTIWTCMVIEFWVIYFFVWVIGQM